MEKYLPSKCIKFWWNPYTLNLNLEQDLKYFQLAVIFITIATLEKMFKNIKV